MNDKPTDSEAACVAALAGELRVLNGRLKRRLRQEAHLGDVSLSQASVIGLLLRNGPATVTTLARAEGVRPQSMGATVAALEAAGYLRGAPDPADGRRTILAITNAAREQIAANRMAREDWLFRTIRERFSPAEQAELSRGVELLKRLVDI